MLIGLLAWPLDMAIAVYAGMPWWFYTRWGTAALVALGVLGLVAEFYQARPAPGWLGQRLSEVGRTAAASLPDQLPKAVVHTQWNISRHPPELARLFLDDDRAPVVDGVRPDPGRISQADAGHCQSTFSD